MNSPHAHRRDRGTTLLEAVISLSILLIGIAGTMQLQVLGITANSGSRAQTRAYQLARELSMALTELPPNDPLVTLDLTSDAPPPEYGHLLISWDAAGNLNLFGPNKPWDDATMSLPGVSTDLEIVRSDGSDPNRRDLPRFRRFWQVWQLPTAAAVGAGGVNLVLVSVIYSEPKLPGYREVVLLNEVSNHGLGASFVAAYR